jgi:hypothetical protein
MHYSEEYSGFRIVQVEKPYSLNMWQLQIVTDDETLKEELERYRKRHGALTLSPGDLDHSLGIAREYIDAVLTESA